MQHHIAACPVCGHARLLHNLCSTCLHNARKERSANRKKVGFSFAFVISCSHRQLQRRHPKLRISSCSSIIYHIYGHLSRHAIEKCGGSSKGLRSIQQNFVEHIIHTYTGIQYILYIHVQYIYTQYIYIYINIIYIYQYIFICVCVCIFSVWYDIFYQC